jgi:hypothetical protein
VLKDAYAQMQRGQSISLTLCGEKAAQHWISQKPSIKSFFTNLLPSQSKHLLLKQL